MGEELDQKETSTQALILEKAEKHNTIDGETTRYITLLRRNNGPQNEHIFPVAEIRQGARVLNCP